MATRAEVRKGGRPARRPAGRPAGLLIALIHLYKYVVSPGLRPACRFYPSCSEYAIEAVTRYGLVRGAARGIRRLSRCHPLHSGGVDLVD